MAAPILDYQPSLQDKLMTGDEQDSSSFLRLYFCFLAFVFVRNCINICIYTINHLFEASIWCGMKIEEIHQTHLFVTGILLQDIICRLSFSLFAFLTLYQPSLWGRTTPFEWFVTGGAFRFLFFLVFPGIPLVKNTKMSQILTLSRV